MGTMMTASTAYLERWTRIGEQAARARAVPMNRLIALVIVVFYNAVGLADVASTVQAINLGAVEVNPMMRSVMEAIHHYWIAPKLAGHLLVSAMILWFPHRFVLALFAAAALTNFAVVLNNYQIVTHLAG